ncbi:MAG: TrkH family potassium uptake protein [Clostridia bacterium]|nr:TrkH family potassium uptake protein [Clostridia bacterium]
MNYKMVFQTIGKMYLLEAALLLLPLCAGLIYHEHTDVRAFLITIAVALGLGLLLILITRTKNRDIFAREGFAIVGLAWFALSAVGALPFLISREIPSYIDAVCETVSGFTTTGASILPDVSILSHGVAFWRSFTHWIGGMGVLVLMMAIFPSQDSGRSIHIMRAEMPGPVVGKLVPRIRETARILYVIYIGITLIQAILLCIAGMPLFDSIVHTFGTAGTGGFGIKPDSIAGYNHAIQWIITVFMLIFGINFNLFYLVLTKKFRTAIRSRELWCFFAIVLTATALITWNITPICEGISESLRLAAFQVASIISTTGYATTDFDLWPQLSKGILFLLMFIGGCAGSTAGGLKVSRVMLMFRMAKRDLKRMIHPRSMAVVHMDGKRVEDETMNNLGTYLVLYFVSIAAVFLILSFEPFDFETNLSATVSCFNNIGPAFGAAGPTMCYAGYSDFAKFVLSVAMLLGRLEIIPLLIALSPYTWLKK